MTITGFQSLAMEYSGDILGWGNFLSSLITYSTYFINPVVNLSSKDFNKVKMIMLVWRKA